MNDDDQDLIAFGIIGRPHGVKGELYLRLYNPDSDNIESITRLRLRSAASDHSYQIVHVRHSGQGTLIRLKGIESRTAAAALTGHEALIPRQQLAQTGPNEWYYHELIGCEAILKDETLLGTVAAVIPRPGGAHLQLSLAPDANGRTGELEIPLGANWVHHIDSAKRCIRMDPPAGYQELIRWTSK